jgi:hypothetical protein
MPTLGYRRLAIGSGWFRGGVRVGEFTLLNEVLLPAAHLAHVNPAVFGKLPLVQLLTLWVQE